jgi:hypothetical protein
MLSLTLAILAAPFYIALYSYLALVVPEPFLLVLKRPFLFNVNKQILEKS